MSGFQNMISGASTAMGGPAITSSEMMSQKQFTNFFDNHIYNISGAIRDYCCTPAQATSTMIANGYDFTAQSILQSFALHDTARRREALATLIVVSFGVTEQVKQQLGSLSAAADNTLESRSFYKLIGKLLDVHGLSVDDLEEAPDERKRLARDNHSQAFLAAVLKRRGAQSDSAANRTPHHQAQSDLLRDITNSSPRNRDMVPRKSGKRSEVIIVDSPVSDESSESEGDCIMLEAPPRTAPPCSAPQECNYLDLTRDDDDSVKCDDSNRTIPFPDDSMAHRIEELNIILRPNLGYGLASEDAARHLRLNGGHVENTAMSIMMPLLNRQEHSTQRQFEPALPRLTQNNMRVALAAADEMPGVSETVRTGAFLSAHNSRTRKALAKQDVSQLAGGDHTERERVARQEAESFAPKLQKKHWRNELAKTDVSSEATESISDDSDSDDSDDEEKSLAPSIEKALATEATADGTSLNAIPPPPQPLMGSSLAMELDLSDSKDYDLSTMIATLKPPKVSARTLPARCVAVVQLHVDAHVDFAYPRVVLVHVDDRSC